MKSHPHKVRRSYFVLHSVAPGTAFPPGRVGCQFRASFCHLLPLGSTASWEQTAQPHALWGLGSVAAGPGLLFEVRWSDHSHTSGNSWK